MPRAWHEVFLELKASTLSKIEMTPLAHRWDDSASACVIPSTRIEKLWALVHNIGGSAKAARIRNKLYNDNEISHPHIGAWVSHLCPWCPPLANPVGCWQNVYQILVLGMFDSHYMPEHIVLRNALKPIIEQMWHATSRSAFRKVLFAPERFNLRELPSGGSPLKWHIDQDALAPACPLEGPADGWNPKEAYEDPAGGILEGTASPALALNDSVVRDGPCAAV